MHQGEFRTKEQVGTRETTKAGPSDRRLASRITSLALILGFIALSIRLISLRETLAGMQANPALLKAAMRAAAGAPVSTLDAASSLSGRFPPSGFQARAMSEIAQAGGQPATAEAWLVQGLADPSSAYLSQFDLCLLYWNNGRPAQAREACRGTKSSATYWLNRGYEADQRSDPVEALAYFQMAGAVDPDMIPAWHQIGRALFAARRFDEAVLAYERVLALDQTPPPDVYDSLSLSYLELDNPSMARDVLTRGLMIYPGERTYYLGMARSFRKEGDLETADSWYARMLQRWPYDDQAWAARGETAVAAGRLDDALGYYQAAVDNQPQGVGYWMNLAATAAEMENVPLATEAYQQAMALRPQDPTVWLQAGRFLVNTAQSDEARSVFEHVLVLQPDNGEAATQLAAIMNSSQP